MLCKSKVQQGNKNTRLRWFLTTCHALEHHPRAQRAAKERSINGEPGTSAAAPRVCAIGLERLLGFHAQHRIMSSPGSCICASATDLGRRKRSRSPGTDYESTSNSLSGIPGPRKRLYQCPAVDDCN